MKFNTIKVSVMALALAGAGLVSGLSVTANAQTQDKPMQNKPTQDKSVPPVSPSSMWTLTAP